MVVPDLYVFTLKFHSNFSLYKKDKNMKKKLVFSTKFLIFFYPEKAKKRPSKVAHNRPRPFFATVKLRPQPTAQNGFSIL